MTRARISTMGVAVAALLLVSVVGCAQRSDPGQASGGAAPVGDGPQRMEHCGGERVSLSAALDQAPYSVALPEETLANGNDLVAAWDCPGDATLLEFSSGVSLQMSENTIVDPKASWENLANENPKIYSVGTIGSNPASLIDPDGDPKDDAEGGVIFVVDGVHVVLLGNGEIPLKDLVVAAEALAVSSK